MKHIGFVNATCCLYKMKSNLPFNLSSVKIEDNDGLGHLKGKDLWKKNSFFNRNNKQNLYIFFTIQTLKESVIFIIFFSSLTQFKFFAVKVKRTLIEEHLNSVD